MRTTLNLDDRVMRAVKEAAMKSNRTMTEVIEDSLRETLLRGRSGRKRAPFELRPVTVRGRKRPGVDLKDRDSLLEIMEGRS